MTADAQVPNEPMVADTVATTTEAQPIDSAATDNAATEVEQEDQLVEDCLLYTSPSPRDRTRSRMPSSA